MIESPAPRRGRPRLCPEGRLHQVNVYLDEQRMDALRALSRKRQVSISECVREGIALFLARKMARGEL